MFAFALAFCAGAGALHALPALLPPAALALPAAVALLSFRTLPVATACAAGLVWGHVLASDRLARNWPCDRDRESIELTGRVAAPAFERGGRVDFELTDIRSSSGGEVPRRARISWYDATDTPRPGERWRVTARLRCRHGLANPGAADRELDLLRQRLDATGYVAGKTPPERVALASREGVEALRSRIAESIAAAVPPGPSVAVLQGLSVGVRGGIPDTLWEAFAVTGVAHLIAISGLHVTGCALFILALVRLSWRLPWRPAARARLAVESLVVVAATAAYTLLAGASLPALRTLAMVAVAAGVRAARRAIPLHVLLAWAVLVIVASDPIALASAGFWLSVAATAALLAAVVSGGGFRQRARAFAASQAAVFAVLAPVLAASFGRVSLVAPAVNALAIPFFSVVLLPLVLCATVAEAVGPGAAGFLWRALAAILDPVWPWLSAIGSMPASSWAPGAQPPALVACALVVLFAAVCLPLRGPRLAALAMLAAVTFGGASRPAQGEWTLSVVDVGQGLAAVVETSRHVLVFDTGPRWQGGASAARVSLVPFLRSRGIRRIDLVVVSHDDMDHAGGVGVLRDALTVARTMSGQGGNIGRNLACRSGLAWRWDDVEFRVLHPQPGFEGSDNDRSCALAVAGGGGRALLLADPEEAAEEALLGQQVAADVVLLPHHGSRTSSSAALVARVGARLGISSSGFGNRWGMPAREVVARWRSAGATVLTTAEQGAVIVHFGARPREPVIRTWRAENRRWWHSARP